MTVAAARHKPWRQDGIREEDDSTSAQFGDVSSQHSPADEVCDELSTDRLQSRVNSAKCSRFVRQRDGKRVRDQAWDGEDEATSEEGEGQIASQETLPEIYEIEDGGYDGDAEIHYPDGIEEPEQSGDGDEDSEVSRLAVEGPYGDDDALTEKLRRLRVKSATRRTRKPVGAASTYDLTHHAHKRSHSKSADSISEDDQRISHASSPPAQKKARIRTMGYVKSVDPGDDVEAMDVS